MASKHIVRTYDRKILVPEGILGRKKKKATVHVTKRVREDATLLAEKDHLRALLEKHGINVDKNLEKAIERPIYIPFTTQTKIPIINTKRK
ncbi:MAG: hypothetical protein J7L37_06025 [Thermococcus sp.]|nr:hypothetical protein [Thermococcus sp.]